MLPKLFNISAFAGGLVGVTGAAQGIGRATTSLLASLGAHVLAIDLEQRYLDALSSELGSRITPVCANVADTAALQSAIAAASKAHGPFCGWVNNAMYARRGLLHQQPPAEMDQAWQVNVMAAWHAARLLLPDLKQTQGAIVNVSSVMVRNMDAGSTAYVTTKGALEAMTRSLAVELAPHRVRVNAVCPGYILTYSGCESQNPDPKLAARETALRRRSDEIAFRVHHPYPRHGLPEDIAHAVAFLLSDAAGFVTGTILAVDGGFAVDVHFTSPELAAAQVELEQIRQQLDELNCKPGHNY